MTAFNFRSLLLAAIVLSNCITWTASRHHYAHNVHQHRTRHRRQGAGLYLPASYVIPGGEGGGPWGEWGEVSPCSRTCGGGVASQKRICLQPGPEGQSLCTGGDTKYFSCQTQDCPEGSADFRAEQCAEFNDKAFRGFKYNWVPYTKAPNPCELNCMPHGERFYFRHKLQVTDGTRCNDESFDVCVAGKCQPVGCDMMLNSTAREDKCRECRGNGANCRTTDGVIDSQDLVKGYNDVLLIPAGSTNINIAELSPSNNYLALRAKNGTYYLNGHYHIDFPRSILIAGALWTYERSQQGFAAPDKLRCLGPTNEPLYLSLLLQDENVGISYEYSVPTNSAPPTDKRYNWVHEEFTPCSATCGGGFQTRNVTCRSREELEIVDESLCDEGLRPPTNQSCNPDPCPAQWDEGPWGECSQRCGSGGVRSREVTCQKIIANGIKSIVPDKECFDLLGPKPEVFQKCNEDAPCPTWFIGHWKPCDMLCDEGKQTRQVVCYQKKDGRIEVLDEKDCTEEKPEVEQPCMIQPCEEVDWVTSGWTGCDSCTSKNRTRVVVCSTIGRHVVDDSFCSYHNRPSDFEECDKDKLPACEVQWYATQWSKCSVKCGDGVQTRKVFCGMYYNNDDGEGVEMVNDTMCANLTKYKDSKPCTVPKEECPSQWFAGPWTACTEKCGGGEQYRRVMCYRGDKEATDCDGTTVLDSTQFCNVGPCNPDDLLPVSRTSTVVMDDEEDCEEEDYPEIGLDLSTPDLMMSDSPGYAEHESTLETGTDWGSSLSTEEGSGFTTMDSGYTTDDYDTGSGDMSTTEEPDSTTVSEDGSTKTTVVPPTDETEGTGSTSIEGSGSTTSEETGSTETEITKSSVSASESGSTSSGETDSTDTESTGSTTEAETGSTESTLSTEAKETGPTSESSVTSSSDTDGTGSTTEAGTGSTEATEVTSESGSTSSDETGASDTDGTGVTTEADTGSTESSLSTEAEKTGPTSESGSTSSSETGSSDTDGTGATTEAGTGSTESSLSTETKETSETTPTDETESTGTDETETTGDTESTVTESSGPTDTTITEETSPTESTITESTGPTDSTVTESTETTESEGSTESTITEETGSTESTVTETGGSTETTDTEKTGSTESTIAGSESTESTVTDASESTIASEAASSGTTNTEDTSETDESSSGPTASGASTEESSTTESSASSTESSESTVESSTTSGSEGTTEAGSTVSAESTTAGDKSSLGAETSTPSESESTTESVVSTSLASESSGAETSTPSGLESSTETTESGSTVGTESSTESSGSTEGSSTVSGEITTESSTDTGSTPESTGSESSTLYSTTEGTTIEGSTEESSSTEMSTTEGSAGTTIWTKSTIFVPIKKVCKPRRKPKCSKTKFGCCPDRKTEALGPFDAGCPKRPRTCKSKESIYGCCPDGVSPAKGENFEGCPVEPCADTLFGCCASDNKTAAQGNDQEGCPPPPPPCASSEFGCCADNETEATGPEKQGCPETETTTTEALTETTTETTESSETSEGSTTSEGTTDVISTTLDPCSGFQFGCCADNETEAPGPDGQGCPCNTTEFGCCPDGVSPASGLNNEGCPGPCSTSPHGCCQDGKTPAHGPEFEGCCLLQAFGCCPDNRKPAEGPHLEGCGCQYALHGCCPDNLTIAQGPDNQGCGCQYTEHGCCPDRLTAASGPNNEGCGCNTYQFGCCPDGVTIAKGPEQLGCHCRDSKFGCCGDGETPASGPDSAGCDCSSSKHGCCPDGRTEAAGPKFLGCTDAPENRQAACSLPTDPGPCHNFTAMWYYDMAYGGCSRFWYGGCEGNGNRFATKEECDDVCVQPSPKDACKLPSVKGACDADYQRWHYNSTREQCIPFRYGGCLGNANNFDTRELCQKQCEPSAVAGQCDLPIEQGSCAGNFSRWGFNSEAHRCEQFIWGGCEGNSNRFSSEAACQMRCAGTQPPQCTQPQEAGNCSEKEALWSFSQTENRCLPFYYSGCGGNDNRFGSREACEQTCPSAYVPDKCTLPYQTGECSNYRERWFYDTTFKRCRQFYYGGCGGNENNFATEAECDSSCSEVKTTTTTTTTARPVEPQPQTQRPNEQQTRPSAPERSEFCFNPIDAGPCNNTETRFAYDSALGRCVTFQYGGCGGNQNNFPDEAYCSYYCQPMQDICQLPMLQGPCEDSVMSWFYDPTTDSCSQFTYGGCEGNDNRFDSLEACEARCRTGPAPAAPTTPTTTAIVSGLAECRVSESLEECRYGGVVWYFDAGSRECVSHANQQAGALCRYSGTFPSEEACQRSCGAFQGVDVCKQRMDPGPCQSYVTKFYFEPATGQCHEFSYGGCLGGANRFSTMEECSQVCKAEIDPCSLPPEGGNCLSYIRQWYYDASRDQCHQFVYTGCSGNDNRFETQSDCEARCKRPVATTTTVATPPQQQAEEECKTPSSLAPCGNNVTVFYYDSERGQCLVSGFGGCGHANTYSSEEECERRCGAFRGVDVCGSRLDPGPCRASIPKIYWDAMTGSCQPFAYGGCAGGPNRFSSVEECMNLCGDTGPARECLQAADSGQYCDVAPARRWHYSAAHVDCVVFAYLGCGGNDNNFRSYAACADACLVPRLHDCTPYEQECEALDCQYGVDRFTQDGCQRCVCREDPCIRANCLPSERCVAVAMRNPATQEPVYSATCVFEDNEIYNCAEQEANCSRLRCEYGIQRTRMPDGCEQCSCVQVEVDCAPLRQECERLKCNYGVDRIVGPDGCERCKCKEYPCERKACAAGERCVVQQYVNALEPEPQFSAECRAMAKPGACPMDATTTNEVSCRHECVDDADCRGVGKCCRRGCSDVCLVPVETTSPNPLLTTAIAPNVPAAPQAVPQQEPQVEASEGGAATLRCLFHGNPPPKITWRFGELTIDGNAGRYRLTSDGALEIVSLYRNDTGVYICVADNALGQARQEIRLVVSDPVRMPVGIAGDENAVVTGELGQPLHVRCLAYGYPPPSVFWYHGYGGPMVPFNDAMYEARGNVLLIRRLAIETLGEYTCQAYNGEGKAASWVVLVRAFVPEGMFIEHEHLVPRNTLAPRPRTPPPTTAETTTTTTTTTTEAPRPLFTVPVSTHVSSPFSTLNIGADLRLTCEVDGFPEPDVHWTKDGATIQTDSRITITGSAIVSRLTVSRVTVADSGLYACHASNAYSSHSDTAQINVQQLTVPAKCTDNPFFANCDLIVRSKFCRHKYYSKFCCKSCVEAGQLDPQEAELQADQPLKKK